MSEFGSEVGSAYVRLRPDLHGFKQETEVGVKSALSGALAGTGKLIGGAFAAAGVIESIKKIAEAATEHQAAFAVLDKSLQNAGLGSKSLAAEMEKTLEAEARLKGFSDEELSSAMLRLVSVTKNVPRALADLRASEDLSRARHIGLAAAALALSKAEQGSTTALQRYGIVVPKVGVAQAELTRQHDLAVAAGVKFTGTLKAQYQQQLLTAQSTDKQSRIEEARRLVIERFGGTAKTFAQTASGQFERLSQDVHQFEVNIGTAALPGLAHIAESLGSFFGKAAESEKVRATATGVFHDIGAAAHFAGDAIKTVGPTLLTLAKDAQAVVGGIGAPAILAGAAAYKAAGIGATLFSAAQVRVNALLALGRSQETAKATAAKADAAAQEAAAGATAAYTAALTENTAALTANQGLAATAEVKLADATATERQTAAITGATVSTARYSAVLADNAAAVRLNAAVLTEADAAVTAGIDAKTADAAASARLGEAAAASAADVSVLTAALTANEAAFARLDALYGTVGISEGRLGEASAATEAALAAQTATIRAKLAALAELDASLTATTAAEERLAAASVAETGGVTAAATGTVAATAPAAAAAGAAVETGAVTEARLADAAAAEKEAGAVSVAATASADFKAALAGEYPILETHTAAVEADAAALVRADAARGASAASISAETEALRLNTATWEFGDKGIAEFSARETGLSAESAGVSEALVSQAASLRLNEAALTTTDAAVTGAAAAEVRFAAALAEADAALAANTLALSANRAAAAARVIPSVVRAETTVIGAGAVEAELGTAAATEKQGAAAAGAAADTTALTGAMGANVAAATAELEAVAALSAEEQAAAAKIAALTATLTANDAALAANTVSLGENAAASGAATLSTDALTAAQRASTVATGEGAVAKGAQDVTQLAGAAEKASFSFVTLGRAAIASINPVTAIGLGIAGLAAGLVYLATRETQAAKANREFNASLSTLATGLNNAQDAANALAQSRVDVPLAKDALAAADAAVKQAAAQEVTTRGTKDHAAALLNLRTARDQDAAAVIAVAQAEQALKKNAADAAFTQRQAAIDRANEYRKAASDIEALRQKAEAAGKQAVGPAFGGRGVPIPESPERAALQRKVAAETDRAAAAAFAESLTKTSLALKGQNADLAHSTDLLARFVAQTHRIPSKAEVRYILDPSNVNKTLAQIDAAVKAGSLQVGKDGALAFNEGWRSIISPFQAARDLVAGVQKEVAAAQAAQQDAIQKAADAAIKVTNEKLDAVRAAAKQKIGQLNSDLLTLHQSLDQAILQRQQDLNNAISQAKSNLDAIGSKIAQDISTIIDQPLQEAQQKLAAQQNRQSLEALRRSALLPGGRELSKDPKKALAELQALANQAGNVNRAAIEDFINRYRTALLAVQGDQATVVKQRITTQIADLTDALNRNQISPATFRKKLLADLHADVGDFRKAGGHVGKAFQNALNDEVDAAIRQAEATGAAPHRRGGGNAPQVIRPLETLQHDTREVVRIQKEIGNKQVALQTEIQKNTKKTADLLDTLHQQQRIAHPTTAAAVPGHGARTARHGSGTTN